MRQSVGLNLNGSLKMLTDDLDKNIRKAMAHIEEEEREWKKQNPHKKPGHNIAEINKHCVMCGKDMHYSRKEMAEMETLTSDGTYPGYICTSCYKKEMLEEKRHSDWADMMNRKNALRDEGIVVLEDYQNDRK
jgi:ribosomal protein L34E